MEILAVVLILIILLVVFGLSGWIFKGICAVFEFLLEGLDGCSGCFVYLLLAAFVLGAIAAFLAW